MNGVKKSHRCPIDNRAFATKRALEQHRAAVHKNNGATAPNRGRGRGRRSGPGRVLRTGNCRRVTGTDLLGSFSVRSSSKAGDVIMAWSLSPEFLRDTRLAAEATLFSRWKPVRMHVNIQTSASMMFAGSYVLGWSADPDNWLKDGSSTLTRVSAFVPSVQAPIYSGASLNIPPKTSQKWFLIDTKNDEADTTHGKLYLVLASPLANATGSGVINLMARLNWTVEFDSPNVPPPEEEEQFAYATAGYESYFTDSISDWADGKKLTLKAASGGTAVQFSGLDNESIFKLSLGAKLNYKTNEGMGQIQYGVAIKNYQDGKCLAVFSGLDWAKNYLKTGDNKYCTPYLAAGDKITPSNPAWVRIHVPLKKDLQQDAVLGLQDQIRELQLQLARLSTQQLALPSSSASVFEELSRPGET